MAACHSCCNHRPFTQVSSISRGGRVGPTIQITPCPPAHKPSYGSVLFMSLKTSCIHLSSRALHVFSYRERHLEPSRRRYDNSRNGAPQGRYENTGIRERSGRYSDNKQDFFSPVSWKKAGAASNVVEALTELGITRPSHVQADSYLALDSGAKHVVIADHAGSGKTLAYLLPFIQGMIQEEEILGRGNATVPHSPRLLVVCPTEELCAQVVMVCRALSRVIKFRSRAFTGGHKMSNHISMLKEGTDVAVCTPGRLWQLMQGRHLRLDYCKAVVLDEVDVLLGERGAFQEQVMPLVATAGEDTRIVLVTATLPEPVFLQLKDAFPGIKAVIGPNLHKLAVGVTEQLVDCSGGTDFTFEGGVARKLTALSTLLARHNVPRTIIFCNKIDTCRAVENFIERGDRQGRRMLPLACHAAVSHERRQANLHAFLVPPEPGEANKVLVCTDRASRGIDSAYVEHVVLFDFPRDPSEYVRRVGRTARGATGTGTVSILVMGKQVSIARELIGRNQKGMPVHTVPDTRDVIPATTRFVKGV